MKTRKMAKLAVMAAALLASLPARAATTNEVDIAALIAAVVDAGQSETNGWTLSGLGKYEKGADYASNPACVKFDSLNDWLLSPDFGAQIIRIDATNRCTSTVPTRWLHVLDVKGAAESDLGCFPACLAEKRAEYQSFDVDAELSVSRVKLLLDGSGGTGVWGIGSLKIITADSVYAPSNLQVSHNGGDRCTLSWENGAGTVSNRVDTVLVERSEEGETVLLSTGFDNFSAGGNTEPKTNELAKIDAALSGLRIYSPANTTGVCQIATGTASGYLRHSGFADYSGISLKLVLKQYPGDNDGMQIAYETDNGIKVLGDRMPLPADFEERIVDLSGVPRGVAILIGYDTVASNRRVLIDSLEFVRKGTETKTVVDSHWIPATQGAASFSTRDYGIELLPKSEYRFEVRAQNADGLVSAPAAVDVVLDSLPGFRFILR